jgi:hypothetical protein
MIIYPSWPCNYSSLESKDQKKVQFKPVENLFSNKTKDLFSTQSFEEILQSLYKTISQPSLFEGTDWEKKLGFDSKVLSEDTNPIQDLYQSLSNTKVSASLHTDRIRGSAFVDKQIIDSLIPEGFSSLADEKGVINLSALASKFGIPDKIASFSCEILDDFNAEYFISLEIYIHVNQFIF